MIHIAVRARELISSNVDALIEKAGNPVKMLQLLRTEIEESLITLNGDLGKARRRHERLLSQAQATADAAEGWTAKAKLAMDHKREDLARSALLAREDGRMKAEALRKEALDLESEIAELAEASEKLETKRAEAMARIAAVPTSDQAGDTRASGDTKAERHLDRIERMERRVDFKVEVRAEPTPATVEEEIAALQRDADLAAELAAMKTTTKPGKRKVG
ncbi:PspA/IM30 family protein [Erythrobacter mangrovi]|uniref:PspA/IM30 family protein n=1 Tax=Erythrobacter mangrovi TaxID=2739433 RepID=A0A7D4CNI6_9SPHN|nr:PspA/IM30 family protein [Erythrobacter mangrovi]QKG72088.1 PspA/IM30 family protein [Erythrobacter mangrovi]